MKKIGTILTAVLTIGALASCGGEDGKKVVVKNLQGGTQEEKDAISSVVNGAVVATGAGTTILPTSNLELSADDGDYVLLSTSQKKKGKTVVMTWSAQATGCAYDLIDVDANHKYVDIGFPGKGESNGTITFSLTKISCGSAVSEQPEISYPCVVKAATLNREEKKIAQLNKVTAQTIEVKDKSGAVIATADAGYDMVDYSLLNPYFKTNNKGVESHEYFYTTVPGKVIYKAPDGNWALLADGDEVMEFYSGSAYNINGTRFPALMNNDYVAIDGNMSQYLGNVQLGFMTDMKKIDKSSITEPTLAYQEMTSEKVAALKNSVGGHKQCVVGMNLSNALWEIEGTYVKDSCVIGSTASTDVKVGSRFSFKVELEGGEKVTVAYDYHVCKADNAPKDVFNALKDLVQNGGKAHIKGTLRYSADDSQPFYQTETVPGEWQLVPFFNNDVAIVND